MDGSMIIEYKHRVGQMKEFANRIKNAPLSHHDAFIVYESLYRAMIRYPLAVTHFSPKQCHSIQQPAIDALLPKMGLNQKMPRAVIYGPLSLGGREIMDLRNEQITSIWESMRGHMCRNDRAGKGLRLTLHDHQCIIGSLGLFLNEDPNTYNYGMDNTRWYFIWKSIWENSITVEFHYVWLPRG